ncbi:MAG: hypothetical protein F6K39_18560 [Okeania sp. SIO3B3]|nr:hypothetical protein [Okeania sp. SIO3B3]
MILVIADRFYPSSHISSNCGHQQKMPLYHVRLNTYTLEEVRQKALMLEAEGKKRL